MGSATQIVFRRLTAAEFFNIYKPPGAEKGGGGQAYIDVNTSSVSIDVWRGFLRPAPELRMKGGAAWDVQINNLGDLPAQSVRIGQRRAASVAIRSQKIDSLRGNRLYAWHPRYTDFPQPAASPKSAGDSQIPALIDGLVVYLIRDSEAKIWAGWFKSRNPNSQWVVDPRLLPMFRQPDGIIYLDPSIEFDEGVLNWPFERTMGAVARSLGVGEKESPSYEIAKSSTAQRKTPIATSIRSESELLDQLFDADEANGMAPTTQEVVRKIKKRNSTAVKLLKKLYRGKCQITGSKYIFNKIDGDPYLEAHHLVPLGKGGADLPYNLIVVSAHVHRMLHLASVSGIDLKKIGDRKLKIKINDEEHTITWHEKHAETIKTVLAKKAL